MIPPLPAERVRELVAPMMPVAPEPYRMVVEVDRSAYPDHASYYKVYRRLWTALRRREGTYGHLRQTNASSKK
jgi:hypothetical protein